MGSVVVGERNKMLDAYVGKTTYTAQVGFYVQLHLGDPGGAGTSNKAVENTRKSVTFGSGAASGTISNTAAIEWLSVSTTETYSHISLWTTVTDGTGTFLGSDDLSSTAAVTAGDTFRIPIGDLDISVT
jgi:hypothetical protein